MQSCKHSYHSNNRRFANRFSLDKAHVVIARSSKVVLIQNVVLRRSADHPYRSLRLRVDTTSAIRLGRVEGRVERVICRPNPSPLEVCSAPRSEMDAHERRIAASVVRRVLAALPALEVRAECATEADVAVPHACGGLLLPRVVDVPFEDDSSGGRAAGGEKHVGDLEHTCRPRLSGSDDGYWVFCVFECGAAAHDDRPSFADHLSSGRDRDRG